jgi:hypothetical protein
MLYDFTLFSIKSITFMRYVSQYKLDTCMIRNISFSVFYEIVIAYEDIIFTNKSL